MPNAETLVQKFDRSLPLSPRFRTGVSLHSHTMHSREYLGDLPRYLTHIPVVSYIIEREVGRSHLLSHRVFDFRRMYWTPPLSPREAFELEQKQIEEKFGLPSLVSLSDHDSIEAGLGLRTLSKFPYAEHTPISVEWSVPYEQTMLHFGIHNLPLARAKGWMDELAAFTANPDRSRLREILYELSSEPETLIVFNHPFWDIKNFGSPQEHRDFIAIFLQRYGHAIHALEVNGMRTRAENKAVLELAESVDMPVVSGGDRHGCEPNAVLNLTAATTFADFVEEIRIQRRSEIVLMPQYFDPLRHRILESAWHALCDAPGEFGRRYWMSRVFLEGEDGSTRPVSDFTGTKLQTLVDKIRWIMGFLLSPQVRPAVRLAFLGQEEGGL
jgi:hypothetical protein